MSVEINPRRLQGGPWTEGYALHSHTLSATFAGHDQYGHPQYDKIYSPVGELLYKLKYRNDQTSILPLAEAARAFIQDTWKVPIDAIVPVPASKPRGIQPVEAVAKTLGQLLGVETCFGCVTKIKKTPQLKDLTDYDMRRKALADAFQVTTELTNGKNLLLFDDLFGSGATVAHIVEVLKNPGGATAVYLLTLTTKR